MTTAGKVFKEYSYKKEGCSESVRLSGQSFIILCMTLFGWGTLKIKGTFIIVDEK
ncbi:hypothetical protein [Ureibacillus thermosphaericus]|uniref:hypothetical protein n=1 Tax=Ureibacillus thermosphaericus TaxID=51173 RepID=UPI0030CA065E